MRAAVAVAVLTLLVAPAASAQTVPDVRPPDAYLSSATGGEVKAEIQAYCWREPRPDGGGFGVCADRFDAIDPAQTLVVTQGDLLTLRFDQPLQPRSVTVERVATSVSPPLQTVTAPPENPTRFRADFPPGTHILRVFTQWEQGDAMYVFEVSVQPRPLGPGIIPADILEAIGDLEGRLSEVLASVAAILAGVEELLSQFLPALPPG